MVLETRFIVNARVRWKHAISIKWYELRVFNRVLRQSLRLRFILHDFQIEKILEEHYPS